MTVLTPANAPGAVNVTVQNPDTQTAVLTGGFTYVLPPPAATIKSALKSGANLMLVWVGGTNAKLPAVDRHQYHADTGDMDPGGDECGRSGRAVQQHHSDYSRRSETVLPAVGPLQLSANQVDRTTI